jgi:hypothetical protein
MEFEISEGRSSVEVLRAGRDVGTDGERAGGEVLWRRIQSSQNAYLASGGAGCRKFGAE